MEIDHKLIFDNTPTEIMIYDAKDPKFKMLAVTKAHLKTLGRTKEEIIGKNVFDVFPDVSGNAEKVTEAIKKAIETKEVSKPDPLRYDIPNGIPGKFDKKYWALTYNPIIDKTGEVLYVQEISMDITELVERGLPIP